MNYSQIIEELNRRGVRTRRGRKFGRNSLHEILRNEKYTGVYIYRRSALPDMFGNAITMLTAPVTILSASRVEFRR